MTPSTTGCADPLNSGRTDPLVASALARAARGFEQLRGWDAGRRAGALRGFARELRRDATRTAALITAETAKPIAWSRTEVERAASIVDIAAEEATRVHPEAQRLDGQPSGVGRLAVTRRVPRGPVLAISPFNFPLHLAVHKVAPALALGASVVLVPSPRAEGTATVVRDAVVAAGFGEDAVTVVPADPDHTRTWSLVRDPGLPVVSFTGSESVGWRIVDAVPRKQVVVELGGNASAIIAPDYTSDDDLRYAAARIALFGYYHGGQACTSPQRVYVPHSVFERFVDELVAAARQQNVGPSDDPGTDVGPLIDEAAAERVARWIDDAVEHGARIRFGGWRDGRTVHPTVVTEVPENSALIHEEVFGPVVSVFAYADLDEAFEATAAGRFGLSAGVFTRSIELAFRALDELGVGQVVIGDAPTFRSDYSPFGGLGASGRGREGIRSAMVDYTVERTLVFSGVTL